MVQSHYLLKGMYHWWLVGHEHRLAAQAAFIAVDLSPEQASQYVASGHTTCARIFWFEVVGDGVTTRLPAHYEILKPQFSFLLSITFQGSSSWK